MTAFLAASGEGARTTEVYQSADLARASLWSFAAQGREQSAEDGVSPQIGDESHLFVTVIAQGRRRITSYALCWSMGEVVGKLTLIGPQGTCDKGQVVMLAQIQARRLPPAG